MSGQIAFARTLSRFGLALMSAASAAFLLYGPEYGILLPCAAVFGAGLALGARIQARRLEQAAIREDSSPGVGGYPLDVMRRAGLTDR
jgi:uncharacterized membrane protein YfcA